MELESDRAALRLRRIPDNTVVHTPTEAEAKELLAILYENGYKWRSEEELVYTSYAADGDNTCYCLKSSKRVTHLAKGYFIRKGYTIFTLAEFKELYLIPSNSGELESQPAEKEPQPKFKVGDRVWAIIYSGQPPFLGTVTFVRKDKDYEVDIDAFSGQINKQVWCCRASDLEPYTEPETKGETMETKEKQKGEKGNNSENSQLDLCELLKGHEGIILYSPLEGEVRFEGVRQKDNYGVKPIVTNEGSFCANGKWQEKPNAVCCLYPSRALYEQHPLDAYAAWMKWQEEQKKPFICIHWGEVDCNGDEEEDYTGNTYFRTSSDRDKCIEVIDAFLSQIQQSKSVASLCEEINAIIEKYREK